MVAEAGDNGGQLLHGCGVSLAEMKVSGNSAEVMAVQHCEGNKCHSYM